MSDLPVMGVTEPPISCSWLRICPPDPFAAEPHFLPDVPKTGHFLNLWLPKQGLDMNKETMHLFCA